MARPNEEISASIHNFENHEAMKSYFCAVFEADSFSTQRIYKTKFPCNLDAQVLPAQRIDVVSLQYVNKNQQQFRHCLYNAKL